MSEKVTIICVKKTGHILAALTRAADPEAEVKVEDLAGEELVVRGVGNPTTASYPNARFLVPAGELKAVVVDSTPGLAENPRGFRLDDQGEVQALDPTNQVTNATRTGAQVDVTVSGIAITAAKAAVWVLITDPDPQKNQVLDGEKAAGATFVSVGFSPLGPGAHHFLTLVAGTPPNAFLL